MNDSTRLQPAAARASPLSPFKYRIFLAIWLASLTSNFGGLIQAVGASWLMTRLSPAADIVALVQASTVLPIVLFSLVAGAAADVFDRRWLMVSAQVFAMVVSIILCVVTYAGFMTPVLLLTFTFAVGCGNAIYGPAWQSSVGELVPRKELPAAVALNSLGFNLARTAGPAIGGLIVAAFGSLAAFLVNSVTYVGLIAVLLTWKRPVEEKPFPPESIPGAIVAGLRYVRLSPAVRSILVRAVIFGTAASGLMALMPLIARDLINGGPSVYGLLLGAFGVGAVLSALVTTHLRTRLAIERIVGLACFSFAGASVIAAFSTALPLTMVGTLMGGAGWVLALATFNVSVQLSVPRWVVGRSVAVYQALTFGGMALGSWLWGVLAHHYGLPTSLALAGAVLAVLPLLSRVLPLPNATEDDLDPRQPNYMPTLDNAVPYRDGQVIISIEYRVARADALRFADAMRDVRQSRRRNGARRWTLTVDVSDPELWVERYQYPSWLDYLRQRHRGTLADHAAAERARTFHRGEMPPKVRRLMTQPPEAIAQEMQDQAERTPATSITDPALPPDPSSATGSSTSDSPTGTPSGRTR